MESASPSELSRGDTAVPNQGQICDAAQLLSLGAVIGLGFHWLAWGRAGGGAGLLVWTLFVCTAVLWINRHESLMWRRELLGWMTVATLAALLATMRDAVTIKALMYLTMLLCVATVYFRSRGGALIAATLPSLLSSLIRFPARVLLAIFPPLETVIRAQWQGESRTRGVVRGVMLAAPLLFVFVMLFASADAVFSRHIERFGQVIADMSPSTPLISVALIVLATGILSCSIIQPGEVDDKGQPASLWPGLSLRLGREETAVVMGSLALLFAVFVLLQASYLFGGRELMEVRSGLTVAEYARRGFFELVAVAGLTLGLLVVVSSARCHQGLFRFFGHILIACVLVILASAVFRLKLYIEQFGLTMARVMALALMAWLTTTLIAFSATVLRGQVRGFLASCVYAGIACALMLALANPAARVAEVNIHHARSGAVPLDLEYLGRLGADVVPIVLHSLTETGNTSLGCFVARQRFSQWWVISTDWRDWNASRSAAHKSVHTVLNAC